MEGHFTDKTEQIVNACYNAGWDGAITAAKAGEAAWKDGAKRGKRRGFLAGIIFAAAASGIGAAIAEGTVVEKIKNLFKGKKHEDPIIDDDDFEDLD